MRAADEVEVVFVEELGGDLRPEGERHAAVVLTPTHRVLQGQMFSMEVSYSFFSQLIQSHVILLHNALQGDPSAIRFIIGFG